MPEYISLREVRDKPAGRFALAALVAAKAKHPEIIEKHVPGAHFEVSLIVNGVEVPFQDTIEDIYRRFETNIQQRAAEIAYETASLKGLDELQSTIKQADGAIRQKIYEVFGINLEVD